MKTALRTISALVLAATFSVSAQAAVLSTSGTLPATPTGSYHLYNFDVTTAGTTTLRLEGTTDAYLGLFSGTNVLSSATFIAQDDDGGNWLDSFLSLDLTAGSYTAWITSHGSYWSGDSIVFNHHHAPMSYTLTVTGDVAATAVPEPASLAIVGLGLAGLIAGRRRRKA